jgi:hypothetical protein
MVECFSKRLNRNCPLLARVKTLCDYGIDNCNPVCLRVSSWGIRGHAAEFFVSSAGSHVASYCNESVTKVAGRLRVPTMQEQYPLAKDHRVLATLWQIWTICKSCEYPLRNLSEGCQCHLTPYDKICLRVVNNLWHICKRVASITNKGASKIQSSKPRSNR